MKLHNALTLLMATTVADASSLRGIPPRRQLQSSAASTGYPTPNPTGPPTPYPTDAPSPSPTEAPSPHPTEHPSPFPTVSPTAWPSTWPTSYATEPPTKAPTLYPTDAPFALQPTQSPMATPLDRSQAPTLSPTAERTAAIPTGIPTRRTTESPTGMPTGSPTSYASALPTTNSSIVPIAPTPTTSPTVPSNTASTLPSTSAPTISPTSFSTTSPTTGATGSTIDLQNDGAQLGIITVPITSEWAWGRGFDLGTGLGSNPFNFSDTHNVPTNKYPVQDSIGIANFIQQKITTHQDMNKVVAATASVSGSYCGVTASATVSYFDQSDVSTNSVSFYIANRYIHHRVAFTAPKMTQTALNLFKYNPHQFVEIYGRQYVAEIKYGAQFDGSMDIFEKNTASTHTLDATFDMSAPELFASVSVSASISTQLKQETGTVTSQVKATATGGDSEAVGQSLSPDDAQSLKTAYEKWVSSIHEDNLVPVSMVLESYFFLPEVAQWVAMANNTALYETLFKSKWTTPDDLQIFSSEQTQLTYISKAVDQAQSYSCQNDAAKVAKDLSSLAANNKSAECLGKPL